jgi:hypothetical protein
MIKKISSGGDNLIGRNHCKAEEEFITHFLAICLANDIPNIKPYDDAVDGRNRVVSYKKTYVNEPTNELGLLADPNIESEVKTIAFQKAFIGLLIHQYAFNYNLIEPVDVINAKKDWITEDKNVIDTFKYDFEITNNETDFIASKQIEDWITLKKLGITMKKFGMEMKKYSTIHKLDNVKNNCKTMNGKVTQVWVGIYRIEEEEND